MENVLKYRSRTDIIVLMLTTAKELQGVNKTRIMYEAFVSYAQMKEYLELLLGNGMLEHIQNKRYRTTEKGLRMIDAYQRAAQLVGTKDIKL